MKLKSHDQLLKLLRVPKHELHSVIKEHVEWRRENEPTANTLNNLNTWYKKFRVFLYQYDKRNVSLSNQGIGADYLAWLSDQGYANSYVVAQFKILLATISRLGIYHNIETKELFRGYAKESKENEDYFLNDDEVKQLLNLEVEDNMLRRICLDAFIVSCFTGCRFSEIRTVRELDEKTLIYQSSKTKKDIRVPYNKVVKPYIESGHFKAPISEYRWNLMNYELTSLLKSLGWDAQVTKYRLMGKKKLSYVVPRYQAITFHSGRKFFGKMLLDMNVSMYKVSQLLGHASIDTTQKYYAALSREKMMDETNELINNF